VRDVEDVTWSPGLLRTFVDLLRSTEDVVHRLTAEDDCWEMSPGR
jgi:hypothetical protein